MEWIYQNVSILLLYRHLSCFYYLDIMNHVTVNILYVFLVVLDSISLGYVTRSRVVLWLKQILPNSFLIWQIAYWCCLCFNVSHSGRYVVIAHCGIFLMTSEIEQPLHMRVCTRMHTHTHRWSWCHVFELDIQVFCFFILSCVLLICSSLYLLDMSPCLVYIS